MLQIENQMELSILRRIGDSKWNDLVGYCRELGIGIRPGKKESHIGV
ncbi:MAG: hypothetical protein GF344_05950 [Chitinivibrionales bacterium]|nr:hypothetical protein [Chitinivibrionales bacterium]